MSCTTKPPTHPADEKADPPTKPPTRTAVGGAEPSDPAHFGAVVPLPPGYRLGPLEIVTGGPTTYYARECRGPLDMRTRCNATVAAQATAAAIAEAWALYLTEGGRVDGQAVARAHHVPQPEPAAGITHTGPLTAARVTFTNPLTLTAVRELVPLGDPPPRQWKTAGDARPRPEHVAESAAPSWHEFYGRGTVAVNQMRAFLHGVGPVPGITDDGPHRVSMTCPLRAVGEDANGNIYPADKMPAQPGGATSFGGTFVRIDMDEAGLVAKLCNSLRELEADIARRVREALTAARGGVAVSRTPGEGFVPAYPVRRRAEDLTPRPVPKMAAGFHGFISFDTVTDTRGRHTPGVCRFSTAPVEPDPSRPAPLVLSSFYRPDDDEG